MQTVELEFTKIKNAPVPTSLAESLFALTQDGVIHSYRPIHDLLSNGELVFANFIFIPDWEYAHVKVKAKEKSKTFEIGDEVVIKSNGYHLGKVVEFLNHSIGVKVGPNETRFVKGKDVAHVKDWEQKFLE